MSPSIIVIGAGGHAAVVADALLAAGRKVLGFTDSDRSLWGQARCGLPVLGDDGVLKEQSPTSVVLGNGIGGVGRRQGDALRKTVQERLEADGWCFVTVVHPKAVVSPFARVGAGAQLLAGSIVQAGADVGLGCIVNTAAVVEHDVILGDWVHVAPRALVCGNVVVGSGTHVGAGAIVRQGLRIGVDTLIGAGAVVVRDIPGSSLVMGVPARRVETVR